MESFATPYPLVFHDGEQEHDKGFIGVHSMLTFKRFQAVLGQKTGIPPSQLSAVFVCRKVLQGGSEQRQRLPINASTNFSILLNQHNPSKERDCYFLISLKRSKKERKGSRKRGAESEVPEHWDIGARNGLEESVYLNNDLGLEDMLSSGSSHATEASDPPFVPDTSSSKQSMNEGLPRGTNQGLASDDNFGGEILKRGNTSFFRKREKYQADNVVPLNSPRFAALREEDRRDINWRWEDSFPKASREQWELQAFYMMPHYASDVGGFSPHSPEHCNVSTLPTKGQVLSGRGEPMQTYHHNFYRNGIPGEAFELGMYNRREFFSPNHVMPKFKAPKSPSSTFLRDGNLYLERQRRKHILSEGLWQRMPGALSELSHKPFGIHCEDTVSRIFCQLCFECKKRDVSPIPFHWCVEDAVVQGSRGPSPAGPIARPAKIQHMEAIAA